MTEERPKSPACPHCGRLSRRVRGRVIYPHRDDLASFIFYACKPCGAYVGTHKGTGVPLGIPANEELRKARQFVHSVFDPIWKNAYKDEAYRDSDKDEKAVRTIQHAARSRCYRYLASRMGIPFEECHIAMFDIGKCRTAYRIAKDLRYRDVRKWSKERSGKKS